MPDTLLRAQPAKWSETKKKQLIFSFICCAVCFFVVHGYYVSNSLINHDSLKEFYGITLGNDWKIQLGRIFVPFYRMLRTSYTPVWLIGMLSILFFSLTLYLLIRIFNVKSKAVAALMAAVLISNNTITSLMATYVHDMDSYILALLCSVFSVYVWKNYKYGFVYGILPNVILLGIYQSYLSVTIVLIIMVSILRLLNRENLLDIWRKGLQAIVMLAAAGVIYLLCLKFIPSMMGMELVANGRNGILSEDPMNLAAFLHSSAQGIRDTFDTIFDSMKSAPRPVSFLVNGLVIFCLLVMMIYLAAVNKLNWKYIVLLLLLLCAAPFAMNLSQILAQGFSHSLMYYSMWLTYVLALLLGEACWRRMGPAKALSAASCLFIGVILWNNVITANVLYMKRTLESDSTQLAFNRILSDLEEQDFYTYNESKVIFAGSQRDLFTTTIDYARYESLAGMSINNSIGPTEPDFFRAYFDYVLRYPINLSDDLEQWQNISLEPAVREMPRYPQPGYIRQIGDLIVIKLSNYIPET